VAGHIYQLLPLAVPGRRFSCLYLMPIGRAGKQLLKEMLVD